MAGPILTSATLSSPPAALPKGLPPAGTAASAAPAIPIGKKEGKVSTIGRINKFLEGMTRVSLTDRTMFTQNLHVMIKSSMPLALSLGTLSQQTKNKRLQAILLSMKQRIEKGETFASALSQYKKVFSEVYVNMVAAGESSGKLETILAQLAKQLKKERTLNGKIRGALMYPVIVMIAMVVIGAAMIVFVIPKIADIYKQSDAILPLPTQLLINTSMFVVHNGILVSFILVVLVIAFIRFRTTRAGMRTLHRVYLLLPVMSTITKKINLARFSRTLHSLLQTDIPIVQAFQIIERTLGNVYYRAAIEKAAQELKRGITVADALKQNPGLFPPLVTQMLAVGEESGTLDELSDEIANFYEEDVDETMTNFSAIIEPVLMLILGVGVGGMALAIMLPIYSLTQQI